MNRALKIAGIIVLACMAGYVIALVLRTYVPWVASATRFMDFAFTPIEEALHGYSLENNLTPELGGVGLTVAGSYLANRLYARGIKSSGEQGLTQVKDSVEGLAGNVGSVFTGLEEKVTSLGSSLENRITQATSTSSNAIQSITGRVEDVEKRIEAGAADLEASQGFVANEFSTVKADFNDKVGALTEADEQAKNAVNALTTRQVEELQRLREEYAQSQLNVQAEFTKLLTEQQASSDAKIALLQSQVEEQRILLTALRGRYEPPVTA